MSLSPPYTTAVFSDEEKQKLWTWMHYRMSNLRWPGSSSRGCSRYFWITCTWPWLSMKSRSSEASDEMRMPSPDREKAKEKPVQFKPRALYKARKEVRKPHKRLSTSCSSFSFPSLLQSPFSPQEYPGLSYQLLLHAGCQHYLGCLRPWNLSFTEIQSV